MRKKLLLGLTLTTCLTAPSAAESWYEVGNSDNEIAFADGDSIARNGGNVVIDAFQGFVTAQGDGANIMYAKHRIEFDCSGNQLRELSVDAFDSAHASLGSVTFDNSWTAIQTGTFGEAYKTVACNGVRPGSPYADPFVAADDYWDYMYYYYDT